MKDKLKSLFMDNPCLAEQVYDFCNARPEFREAERKYQALAGQLRAQLGHEAFDIFDEAQSWYMAKLLNAYYLFGLGLRQEVIEALDI